MRTLRSIMQSLANLPSGFSADGRPLGLGLDAAMRADARTRRPAAVSAEPPVRSRDSDRVASTV